MITDATIVSLSVVVEKEGRIQSFKLGSTTWEIVSLKGMDEAKRDIHSSRSHLPSA